MIVKSVWPKILKSESEIVKKFKGGLIERKVTPRDQKNDNFDLLKENQDHKKPHKDLQKGCTKATF